MGTCSLGGSPESPIFRLSDEEKAENKQYWKAAKGYNRRLIIEIIMEPLPVQTIIRAQINGAEMG